MKARQTINKTRAAKAAVSMLFIIAFAAFFIMLPENQASAAEKMMILNGQVTAIDSYNKTISVMGTQGEVMLNLDKSTNIVVCEMNKSFDDLRAGQNVTINYYKKSGKLIAQVVDIAPVILACYEY